MTNEEFVARVDRVALVRRLFEENRKVEPIYSSHAVIRMPWAADPATRAFEAAFPDYEVQVLDAFESADKVTVRWRVRARHSGEFDGIKPSNAVVDFTGINIYRFVGDKVVESWGQVDAAALAQACAEQGQAGDVVIKMLGRRRERAEAAE